MCSNFSSIAGSTSSGPRPRSHLSFHLDFTTNAPRNSAMSSASVSRSVSIHFWRLAEITVALYWRRATVNVTRGPTIEATNAVLAETRLTIELYSMATNSIGPNRPGGEGQRGRRRKDVRMRVLFVRIRARQRRLLVRHIRVGPDT